MKRKKETTLEKLWDCFWRGGVCKLAIGTVILSVACLVGLAGYYLTKYLIEHPILIFLLILYWLVGHIFMKTVMDD